MKKGLGSIPKNLAWIDEESFHEEREKKPTKKKQPEESSEKNSSKNGLPYGWTRATFIIKEEYCKKIKALAYWERVSVKDIMDELLDNFLQDKKIRAIPKKTPKDLF